MSIDEYSSGDKMCNAIVVINVYIMVKLLMKGLSS